MKEKEWRKGEMEEKGRNEWKKRERRKKEIVRNKESGQREKIDAIQIQRLIWTLRCLGFKF